MSLRGPIPSPAPPERKAFTVYARPRTQLLLRALAENRNTSMGRLLDQLVEAEAATDGISVSRAS